MSAVTSATRDIVWDTPPGDLIVQNQKGFAATGATEEQVRALMANKWYSLTTLTHLAIGLESLAAVRGREQIVAFASRALSEDVARIVGGAVAMLLDHHKKAPLAQVSAPGPIVGRGRDGALIVPAPVDYVAWTERAARFARRPELAGKARTVWITGTFSPRAKKELAAAGWTTREGAGAAPTRWRRALRARESPAGLAGCAGRSQAHGRPRVPARRCGCGRAARRRAGSGRAPRPRSRAQARTR